MRRIAHISDLHFGAEEEGLVGELLKDLHEQTPSLVAISGDFTQRARRSQYHAARQFLTDLALPWIAVPGNHDVPLFDVVRRFLSPLGRYRKFINRKVDCLHEDADLAILGINTARSLTWKSGRISTRQIQLIRETMGKDQPGKFKVVMTHHPFIPPPGDAGSGIDLVGRAALAVPVLDECRVDLLLAGHLHLGYSGSIAPYYPVARHTIISVQAGTAISRRRRNAPNAYNLISLDRDRIKIEVRLWRDSAFIPGQRVLYELARGQWQLTEDKTVAK